MIFSCVKNTPLWAKNASVWVWKKIFSKYFTSFLDTAGDQISDLWLYSHFLLLLHLIQAQLGPFSFIWNIWMQKNEGQGWNFRVKYLDVEKIYDIALFDSFWGSAAFIVCAASCVNKIVDYTFSSLTHSLIHSLTQLTQLTIRCLEVWLRFCG